MTVACYQDGRQVVKIRGDYVHGKSERCGPGSLVVSRLGSCSVLLWGPPGTGKSSAVASMCETIGVPYEVVIASIREPSDFSGLPVVKEEQVEFAPPRWAKRLSDAGGGLLFLDEISTASARGSSCAFESGAGTGGGRFVVTGRTIDSGSREPSDQAADGWDLSSPLANRFCHLDWLVDPVGVATGLMAGFPSPRVPNLPGGWEKQIPSGAALVGGFLAVRPSLVIQPPTERALAGKAWPSPRTWEMLSKLLAAAQVLDASPEIIRNLVIGCVGEGAGIEFLTWLQELDLPDPEIALRDPDGVVFPDRGDRLYAALSAVAGA